MALLPDPHHIRMVAVRIRAHAGAVHDVADDLAVAMAAAPWSGTAADAFDAHAAVVVLRLRTAARQLQDAGAAMTGLACAMEDRIAQLRLLADPTALLADAGAVAEGAVHAGLRLVGLR